MAKHDFCGHSGIKSFYVPRSHQDGISVNVNCLNRDIIASIGITPFDGVNRERNVSSLSLISD